ncbi:MAG TPA: SIS domain-containing protein [Planctomycetaceae bacterium]|nr:SIS domain-containing protein [Planctomycetaceae bacterium]HRF00967.1 SIS domain-containing protein [Pirellulaceae bacterium]
MTAAPSDSNPIRQWFEASQRLFARVEAQEKEIAQAAEWFARSILAGRVVHAFGAGHSRMPIEELWPRYGSFPGFNPIVELSMTFHHPVVGCNGQRQAMFLENVPGFAARILRNFVLDPIDSALIVSSSAGSLVAIEMAEEFRRRGIRVVAIVSLDHAASCPAKRADGLKLTDVADLVLDTGAPEGDAMVSIEGLDAKVAPGSTIGSCLLVNAIKADLARRLVEGRQPPRVLAAANVVGAARSAAMFESAYDEHARRLARLFQHPESE